MKRNTIVAAAVVAIGAAALLPAGWTMAQGKGSCERMACVDVTRAFNQYQRQIDLSRELDQLKLTLQNESESRRAAIETLAATVQKMDLSDPTYAARSNELLKMQIEYKNWFDLKQAELTREAGLWTAKIYKEIIASLSDLALKEAIDVVCSLEEFDDRSPDPENIRGQIRNRKVLFCSKGADLTDVLVERLNAEYKATPKQPMLNSKP